MDNNNELINNKEELKKQKKSFDLNKLMKMDIKDLGKLIPKKTINLKKYTPEKKRKVVAFDMGSSFIKIVEGMYYKDQVTIDKFIKMKTPAGAIVDGEIKQLDKLVLKISEVLKENDIKAKDGMCTNNSTLIINREILIPKVEDDEIDTVVRYEIQQYLPINLDDYILQITILDEENIDGTEKYNVRVIAYPDKIARGYYSLLKQLNLKPYVLDVNYNAVNKFINYASIGNEYEYNENDSAAFIDMGADFINVNIYRNRKLDFTRIIKAGGNDINNYFRDIEGIKFEESEVIKKNSVNLEEDDENSIAVRNIADEWIDKIEKIIQFYNNKDRGNKVEKIFIFGGSAKLRGFESYMNKRLGIRTARLREISTITFNSNDNDRPVDDFINAIGCVIRL